MYETDKLSESTDKIDKNTETLEGMNLQKNEMLSKQFDDLKSEKNKLKKQLEDSHKDNQTLEIRCINAEQVKFGIDGELSRLKSEIRKKMINLLTFIACKARNKAILISFHLKCMLYRIITWIGTQNIGNQG